MSIRRILDDERGQSPMLVLAGVVVFLALGAGLAAALSVGLTTSATLRVNSALTEAATTNVRLLAVQGYDVVAARPPTEEVELTIDGRATVAIRAVTVSAATRTARVTVSVGKYAGNDFVSSSLCADNPSGCVIASEIISGAGLGAP